MGRSLFSGVLRAPASGPSDQMRETVKVVLGDTLIGAGIQRFGPGSVRLVSRQGDNARARMQLADLPDRGDRGSSGQVEIHQRDVRPLFHVQAKRLLGRLRGAAFGAEGRCIPAGG